MKRADEGVKKRRRCGAIQSEGGRRKKVAVKKYAARRKEKTIWSG